MNSVAGDALKKKQRCSSLDEATIEHYRHQRHSHEHLQGYQQGVRRHLLEVHQEDPIHRVANREELNV